MTNWNNVSNIYNHEYVNLGQRQNPPVCFECNATVSQLFANIQKGDDDSLHDEALNPDTPAAVPLELKGGLATPHRRESTQKEFIDDFLSVCATGNINKTTRDNLIFCMYRNTTCLDLPVTVNVNGKLKSNLDQFKENIIKTTKIDCCVSGCEAFIGKYAEYMNCPVETCKKPRFSPCGVNDCEKKMDTSTGHRYVCKPFTREKDKSHLKYRTAYKSMYYRSLIEKIFSLYKLSKTEQEEGSDFDPKKLFQYEHKRFQKTGYMTDILDGDEAINQTQSMRRIFEDVKLKYEREHPGVLLDECSLLFSLFYDGNELFDRSAASLWPLMISILNLDPSFRSKLGLGLFLSVLHDIKPECGCNKSSLHECNKSSLPNVLYSRSHVRHLEKRCPIKQTQDLVIL
jgi:hypothetical protein